MATLGSGDVFSRGDTLGDGLGDLDLLGRRDTRWTGVRWLRSTVTALAESPLVDGLGEG